MVEDAFGRWDWGGLMVRGAVGSCWGAVGGWG